MSTYDLAVLRTWWTSVWAEMLGLWVHWNRQTLPAVRAHAPTRVVRSRLGWWSGAFSAAYGCDVLWGRGVGFLVLGALGIAYFTLLYQVDETAGGYGQPVASEQTRRF